MWDCRSWNTPSRAQDWVVVLLALLTIVIATGL